MVFTAAFLIQAILASAAFAAPSDRLASRVARRSANSRSSRFVNWGPGPVQTSKPIVEAADGNSTGAQTSTNWAGAVLVAESAVCHL